MATEVRNYFNFFFLSEGVICEGQKCIKKKLRQILCISYVQIDPNLAILSSEVVILK